MSVSGDQQGEAGRDPGVVIGPSSETAVIAAVPVTTESTSSGRNLSSSIPSSSQM